MKKRRFVLNCIVMLVIVAVFCFAVLMPQYEGDYQAALVDKADRLFSTQGERIILIGDSNLAFGIDSAKIEEAFGKPVINMGMHGGTGEAFNEQAALLNVHPGDLYVFCPCHYDDNDKLVNPLLVWITVENHFELYPMLRAKDWPDMVLAYPTYLTKCAVRWRTRTGNSEMTNSYRRSAFNEYGDNYYPRPVSEADIDFSPVGISRISDETTERMNRIYKELKKRGADMVVAAYPIALCETVPDEASYSAFEQELSEKLEAPLISEFNDYRYDTSYFYDTYMHLTETGVQIRTAQLIQDLQNYGLQDK